MNRDKIQSCISALGYDTRLTEKRTKLIVTFDVQGKKVALVHEFPDKLLRLPKFHLLGGHGFGKLAHVLTDEDDESGEVCVASPESTMVNADQPELAYRDTVKEHVLLLTQLIEDPAYNRSEQLREFEDHWKILCKESEKNIRELFLAWDGNKVEYLKVKKPRTASQWDLRANHIALALSLVNEPRLKSLQDSAEWGRRPNAGKAIALPLNDVDPAPASQCDLIPWFCRIIDNMDCASRNELEKLHKKMSREYWLIFSARVPDGLIMFAIRWIKNQQGRLPRSKEEAIGWTAMPYVVRPLSRESLVPRGGGSLDLTSKSVLLVGCGSVGSELALRLTSAGIGSLTISDPDRFSEKNLYRHILSVNDIGQLKAEVLAREIAQRHPWTKVEDRCNSLEKLLDPNMLRSYNMIVIAIGSPNVERFFAEHCIKEQIDVPVIFCWLEGYGIGGHAILVVPGTKGCWHCAYVDQQKLTRGLTSNLNFLEPNQKVMQNQGGCGTQFLPYSGIAAGYTAAITADMAVRYFEGQVSYSSKVSWKGSDTQAKNANMAVTRRYRHFTDSLRTLALYDRNCDFCCG